jgi:hypothetical protein
VFRCRDIKERTGNVTAAVTPAMRALGECLRLAHGGGSCGALGVSIDELRAAALSLRGMKLLATPPKCISVTASGACKEWGGNKETEYQVVVPTSLTMRMHRLYCRAAFIPASRRHAKPGEYRVLCSAAMSLGRTRESVGRWVARTSAGCGDEQRKSTRRWVFLCIVLLVKHESYHVYFQSSQHMKPQHVMRNCT